MVAATPPPFDAPAGAPAGARADGTADGTAGATSARAARWFLGAAILLYLVYSTLGVAGPFYWGHEGYHGAIFLLRARMSERLGTLLPINGAGFELAHGSDVYLHHPIGFHLLMRAVLWLLGDAEWVARAVGIGTGLLPIVALARIGRRWWSPAAGAAAAWLMVLSPFVTGLSQLCDLSPLELGAALFMADAYVAASRAAPGDGPLTPPADGRSPAALVALGVGAGLVGFNAELTLVVLSAHALLRRLLHITVAAGRSDRVAPDAVDRPAAAPPDAGGLWPAERVWLTLAVAVGGTLLLHLLLVARAGAFADVLESYRARAPAAGALAASLRQQLRWIELLYARPAVTAGLLWLVLAAGRALRHRSRPRDLLVAAPLVTNALYVLAFPQAAQVHLYRVHFLGAFLVLAAIDLAWALGQAGAAWGERLRPGSGTRLGRRLAQAAVLTLALSGGPHAAHNLWQGRALMGTFGQPGYDPRREALELARRAHARTRSDERVLLHWNVLGARKELWYYLDRNFTEIRHLREVATHAADRPALLLVDASALAAGERRRLGEIATHAGVSSFGPLWLVDFRDTAGERSCFTWRPGEANALQRWFVYPVYPPLEEQAIPCPPGVR